MATQTAPGVSEVLDASAVVALAEGGPVDSNAALKSVLALLLEESSAAFRRQGWRGGTPWPTRITPNVPAILRAAADGAKGWRRRWEESAPTLSDSGRLRQSMAGRVLPEERAVEVGTNVPYARIHQDGGTVTMPAAGRGSSNPQIRPRLYKLLKKAPEAVRKQLGYLFGMDSITFHVRRRPVVELTAPIMDDVKALILKSRRGSQE